MRNPGPRENQRKRGYSESQDSDQGRDRFRGDVEWLQVADEKRDPSRRELGRLEKAAGPREVAESVIGGSSSRQ